MSVEVVANRDRAIGYRRRQIGRNEAGRGEKHVAGIRNFALGRWRSHVRIVSGAPAWMKLITTFPLEHYDIPAFGQRARPGTSEVRQSYYDRLQDLERNHGRALGSGLRP